MIFGISIKNCIKRSVLYQALIFESYYSLRNAYRTYNILYANFVEFMVSLGYDKKYAKSLYPEKQELFNKIVFIGMIVLACFSIVGFRLFQLLSGLVLMAVVLVYHNPVPQIKELMEQGVMPSFENAGKYMEAIDYELLMAVGLGIAMIANAFMPVDSCEEKGEKEKEIEQEKVNEKGKEENKGNKGNKGNTKGGKDDKKKKKKD